jgi:hypothetical protein
MEVAIQTAHRRLPRVWPGAPSSAIAGRRVFCRGRAHQTPAQEAGPVSELVDHRRYAPLLQAWWEISEYIDLFCNCQQRHSRLGNLSPVAFVWAVGRSETSGITPMASTIDY